MADEPQINPSDLLDQSEIDKLLAQAGDTSKPVFIRADGGRGDEANSRKVETYDFRNPVFLSEFEMRRLRILHEDFIRYLSARLSLFLRMEFGLKMARLTTQTYAKFTESLPSPTHICLFKAEPMAGVGILDLNPRLALTIADRLLGGRGHSIKVERYLTEIEINLMEDVIDIILDEWCRQWKGEEDIHPSIMGHESNGRFLQTSPKDAIMLALTLEASFGDCAEQIQIGVPYYTIEPLVKRMQARRQKDSSLGTILKKAQWQKSYETIAMPVRAQWDAFEVTLREIASLRVGDVIELPGSLVSQVRVLLNGTPKFIGSIGLDSERVAVEIASKISDEQENQPFVISHGRKNP